MKLVRHSARYWPLLCILLFFSGCGGGLPSLAQAPYVDFECDQAQSAACSTSSNNKTVYIGFSADASFDCETELFLIANTTQFTSTFDYSGSTTATFNGTYLEGAVSTWVNSSGAPSLNMTNQKYEVCGYLDANSNGKPDSNEPFVTAQITPSEDFPLLTQWIDL